MPIYRFTCFNCEAEKPSLAAKAPVCTICGAVMVREISGPSSAVKERLDNGYMPRAIERYADAERLFRERNEHAKKNKPKGSK